MKIAVIGAGLTGLSAAEKLKNGAEVTVFEKTGRAGGLAATIEHRGFRHDYTGHFLHFKDQDVKNRILSLFDDGSLLEIERKSYIYSHGCYVPYPFQAHTHYLPEEVRRECLVGFLENLKSEDAGVPGSFYDWMNSQYGQGIVKYFMLPYNRKMWAVHPENITTEWMGRFVPRPSAEEIIAGTVGAGTAGSGYNAVFHYPEGGIGGLADRMHAGLMGLVRMNTQVKRVNWKDKIVITDKGEYGYDKLINTSPLGEFVSDILEPADSKLVENAGKLRHTAVLFFSAGWKGGEGAGLPEGCHWIYFPEERFRFYRVGFQSNVSKKTVPEGFSSCYIEISYPPGKLPEKDRIAGIGEEAIAQLKQEKIIPPSAQMDHILPGYMDPAYVLYDSNWSKARSHILGSLKKKGILSGGRYGGWEYSAMEEAVKWGWELAEQCLSG